MRVKTKRVVTIEMDNSDYSMLLDTLGEASKVRSRVYPSLNEKAAMLYGLMTAGEVSEVINVDFAETEKRTAAALAVHLAEHKEILDASDE